MGCRVLAGEYQAVSGGVSVARLVYSQARIIGNQADDPGFFCAGMVREHFYLDGNQKISFINWEILLNRV